MAKRYRHSDLMTFPAGNGAVLTYNRIDQSAALLPPADLELLNRCDTFKTLDDHAQTLATEINKSELSAQPAPVGKFLKRLRDFAQKQGVTFEDQHAEILMIKLQEFVERGLLIAETELLPQRETPPQPDERIVTIGVVTHNRPDYLRQCLVSYIESCARHGRDADFVVVDDSKEESVRDETRRMLSSLTAGGPKFYGGLEEKKQYAEQLIAAGNLPREVVNFALFDVENCGHTVGANRNALLLHTAGELFFSADDDTVCRLARPPQADGDEMSFFSGLDPTSFWFYPDRQTALASLTVADTDVLKLHEHLLGKRLETCIANSAAVSFDRADPPFLRELSTDPGAVRITMTGVYGDSGMWSPSWQLRLTGDSYARLTESKVAYDSAFDSREILRAVTQPTISSGDFCMAYALGLDNRTLLPPFFPVHRNEDGIFAATLKICFDRTYIAHLPWAVMHVPPVRKYSGADLLEKPSVHSMCNVVLACFASFNYPAGMMSDTEGLRALGERLMHLGNSSLNAFEEFVRIYLWHLRSANIAELEEELATRKDAPEFWSRDVVKQIELLRHSLLEEVYQPPRDLLDGRSSDEARQLTQRLIFKFGELLFWWPEIVATAKSLRAEGVRLAVAL